MEPDNSRRIVLGLFQEHREFLNKELSEYITPAFQMVGAGLFQVLLNMTDTAVVGHYSSVELAGMAAAHGAYILFFAFFVGFSSGLDFIFGKSSSAGSTCENQNSVFCSTVFSILFGLFALAGTFVLADYFSVFGAAKDIVAASQSYLNSIAYSLPFTFVFLQLQKFNQALGKTRSFFYLSIWINVLNLLLDVLFVFGIEGVFEGLGSAGAGYSTLGCRIVMTYFAVHWTLDLLVERASSRSESLSFKFPPMSLVKEKILEILSIGAPGGVQYLSETAVYSIITLLAARMGDVSGSANQILYQMFCVSYIIPLSMGSLTSMRVSRYYGEREYEKCKIAGWVGCTLTLLSGLPFAFLFMFVPSYIISVFSSDPAVVGASIDLYRIAPFVVLTQAAMLGAAGALRGVKEVTKPLRLSILGFYFIGLPCGLFFREYISTNILNVWIGLTFGIFVCTLLLVSEWFNASSIIGRNLEPAQPVSEQPVEEVWVSWQTIKNQRSAARA